MSDGSKLLAKVAPAAAVVSVALLVSSPAWLTGTPAGSDTVFHASWYTHFSRQFWAGELYPRWLAGMNGGLGSPVFYYYPPLSHHLTSLLAAFTPAGEHGLRHLAYGTALSFVASGLACYLWLRLISDRLGAAAGAILYLLAPYHSVVNPYPRGAYSELWAFAFMPLVLYFARRLATAAGSRPAFAGLSVSYALLACTHLPATLVFSAVPAAYAYFASGRRASTLLRALAAMALGAGLSAVYLLPALTMQDAASFKDMLADRYFERWITFARANPQDIYGQLLWGALSSAALVVCAAMLAQGRRTPADEDDASTGATSPVSTAATSSKVTATSSRVGETSSHASETSADAAPTSSNLTEASSNAGATSSNASEALSNESEATSKVGGGPRRAELSFWAVVAALSIFMTTFASDPVWRLVPVLQKVQFPWRFQLVLCLAVAGAVAAGVGSLGRGRARVNRRALVFTSLLVACWLYFWAGAALRAYPDLPRPNRPPDPMLRSFDRSRDAPEYRPALAVSNAEHDIETLLQNFCGDLRREPRACVAEGAGTVAVTRADARSIDLRVESASGVTFRVTQFHFPGWRATLDGRPHPLAAARPDGLLLLSAPAGTHDLRLRLEPTAPERLGLLASAASALLLALLCAPALLPKRKRHSA